MNLPKIKNRQGTEFYLVNYFHSKLDAQRELRNIRIANVHFGKRKTFIFSSQNIQVEFSHGVYEQAFYVN